MGRLKTVGYDILYQITLRNLEIHLESYDYTAVGDGALNSLQWYSTPINKSINHLCLHSPGTVMHNMLDQGESNQ